MVLDTFQRFLGRLPQFPRALLCADGLLITVTAHGTHSIRFPLKGVPYMSSMGHLEGQGDSVSRGITGVVIGLIGAISIHTKTP